MFNWYIPQEIKTIGKWIKRIVWATILGAFAGAIGIIFNTVRSYYGY
jgi:hypothetical protein